MKESIEIPIDEYSTPVNITAKKDTKVSTIVRLMQEHGVRHIPIVEDNKPVGILSDRDISLLDGLGAIEDLDAQEVMVQDPFTTTLGTSIGEVAFEMSNRKIGSALVLHPAGELDSIFTSVDGLNALIEIVRGEI